MLSPVIDDDSSSVSDNLYEQVGPVIRATLALGLAGLQGIKEIEEMMMIS